MKAFIVMGRVFKATYEELFLCVYMSVLWWLGTVLIVTAAPAMSGINNVFNQPANYKRVDSGFFWDGAKQNIGKGWILFLILVIVPIALAFNAWFYLQGEGLWRAFAVFWIWVFLLSLMIGQYLFPLYWQQDEKDLKMVLRNAAILAVRFPLYSFLMLIFQILLMALSIALTLPILILTPSMLSLSGNFALVGALQEMDLAPHPPETGKAR